MPAPTKTAEGDEKSGAEILSWSDERLIGRLNANPHNVIACQAALDVKNRCAMVAASRKLSRTGHWLTFALFVAAAAQAGVMIWATLRVAN